MKGQLASEELGKHFGTRRGVEMISFFSVLFSLVKWRWCLFP